MPHRGPAPGPQSLEYLSHTLQCVPQPIIPSFYLPSFLPSSPSARTGSPLPQLLSDWLLVWLFVRLQIRKRRNGKNDKTFFVVQMNCFNTSLSIDRRFDLKVRGGFSAVLAFAAVRCCQYFRLQCGYLSGFSEAWNASLVYRETQMHWCRAQNVHARMHARTYRVLGSTESLNRRRNGCAKVAGQANIVGQLSSPLPSPHSSFPYTTPSFSLHHSFLSLAPLLPLSTPLSPLLYITPPLYLTTPSSPLNHSYTTPSSPLHHSFLFCTPLFPFPYTTPSSPLHHSSHSLTPLPPAAQACASRTWT